MKKKSLLLAVSAMTVAAIGVGTVGTFAWYAASGASITSQVAGTANVTTASNVTTVDSFSVTASFSSPSAPRLTNDSGETYIWDGANNVKVTDSGAAMQPITVTLTIAYTGDNATITDGAIQTMWAAVVDANDTFKLVCADGTDYTSTVDPTNGQSPKDIATGAGTTKKYGLKFASNATTYNTGYVLDGAVTSVDVSFASAQLKGAFSSKSRAVVLSEKVYVGVWGIDGFLQLVGDTYVASITPAISHS